MFDGVFLAALGRKANRVQVSPVPITWQGSAHILLFGVLTGFVPRDYAGWCLPGCLWQKNRHVPRQQSFIRLLVFGPWRLCFVVSSWLSLAEKLLVVICIVNYFTGEVTQAIRCLSCPTILGRTAVRSDSQGSHIFPKPGAMSETMARSNP